MTGKKERSLQQLAEKIAVCQKCPLFKNGRPVAGQGQPSKRLMMIGEAPGYHESVQGHPFVGRAGRLLDDLFTLINLKRDQVFITNILKHRPPNNRDPLPQEVKTCRPFLDQQIKIVNPRLLITLGRFAMEKFIDNAKISQIHGQARWVDWFDERLLVLPLYHPAAALRSNFIKDLLEKDFLKINNILDSLDKKGKEEGNSLNNQTKGDVDDQLKIF